MTVTAAINTAANDSTEITWDPESRLAVVRYPRETVITVENGALLVRVLTEWIGPDPAPFGVLADGVGVRGTDAHYRALAGNFYRKHRAVVSVALFNLRPALRILAEMFRIGTGAPFRCFADEASAREWLRQRGIAA